MLTVVMFALMIFLLLAGLPVAIVLGVVSTAWVILAGYSIQMIASRMYAGIDLFVLMAIPFFILAGEIMNHCGITDRLIKFVDFVIGRVRGGLAQACIYASILFAGITGAAVADVAALGSIFIPSMEKQGYTRKFSAMVVAASSIIGPIIPPSIIVVIYGSVTGLSIGTLFAACVIPGVMVGLGMSAYVALVAKSKNFPKSDQRFEVKAFLVCFKDSILAILMPLIIVGGIFSGLFTPTEAAAASAFYAFFVGVIIYRTVTLGSIMKSVANSVRTSAMLFFIIGFANILACCFWWWASCSFWAPGWKSPPVASSSRPSWHRSWRKWGFTRFTSELSCSWCSTSGSLRRHWEWLFSPQWEWARWDLRKWSASYGLFW